MASRILTGFRFHSVFIFKRYYSLLLTPSLPLHSFHTSDHHPHTTPFPSDHAVITERFVLEQLSEILPIPKDRILDTENSPQKNVRVVDGFLSPVEKIRGVFLQKLKWKSAINYSLSETGVEITPEIFAEVVNWGNLDGKSMVSFFDWVITQKKLGKCTDVYNVILKALGRRGFFGFMEKVLFRMKDDGVAPNGKTVGIVLDAYVARRQVCKAVMMFERLEEIEVRHDSESLAAIIHSLCRWGHASVAQSIFNKMKGRITVSKIVYNEIIGGWAKIGRVKEVERNWEEMVANGLSPDSETYRHRIKCFGRAGRINDAVCAFEKMKEKGCVPDVITYNAIISNFIFAKELDKGIEYYKTMIANNCFPDIDTSSRLICALLKFRRVSDALELYDEMLARGIYPTTGMVTSFIEPLCSYGPPHAAMVIYNKAKKIGCRLSMKAYKLLLMRLSKFGKCGMVLKIWEEMEANGHSSDTEVYEYIIDGLCNTGKLDHAVLVLEESMKSGFCIGRLVYSKLSNMLLEMNKVETAYKLLLKVRDARLKANMKRIWRYNGWHF